MRASLHSGVSDLPPGPGAVTKATVAAAHDPEGSPVLDDTMGEIADTLLLALDAAGVALYEWPADGPPTPLAVRGTHSSPWFSALAERYPGSLLDGTLPEGYYHLTVPPTAVDPEPLVVGTLRGAGIASLLLVPLVHRDQTLGLLATVWRTAHPVSGREVQLARLGGGR